MGCTSSTSKGKENPKPKTSVNYAPLPPSAVASSPERTPLLEVIVEENDDGESMSVGFTVVVPRPMVADGKHRHDDPLKDSHAHGRGELVSLEFEGELPGGPDIFQTAKQTAKSMYGTFKNSRVGIFLLERWLPLQDSVLDVLITIGKQGWLFCSEDGLIWTKDEWWALISCVIIVGTYVVWWLLSFLIIQRELQNFVMKKFPALNTQLVRIGTATFWVIVGVPALALADVFFLFCYPTTRPKKGWLMNMARLRKVTESLGESPAQSFLQLRIFVVKVTTHRMDLKVGKVTTLAVSLLTSLVNLGLTLYDIYTQSEAQQISFVECLKDLLLVGLGQTAPLINNLKAMQEVDYSEEGDLREDHQQQIAGVLRTCEALVSVKFTRDNAITHSGFGQIMAAMEHLPDVRLELPVPPSGTGILIRKSQRFTFTHDNTQTAYNEILDTVKNFPEAHLELPLPSNVAGSLTRSGNECHFRSGMMKELVGMAEALQPRVLHIHKMPTERREGKEDLDLTSVQELTVVGLSEEPLDAICHAKGLSPDMLFVTDSTLSATSAEHIILHVAGNISDEKLGFENVRVSGQVEFSHTYGYAPRNFSFCLRAMKGNISAMYQTTNGQLINLHEDRLTVQRPTARDLSWILPVGASLVELVEPTLNRRARQRCMEMVQRIRTENADFTFAVDLDSIFKWAELGVPDNRVAVRIPKDLLKAFPWNRLEDLELSHISLLIDHDDTRFHVSEHATGSINLNGVELIAKLTNLTSFRLGKLTGMGKKGCEHLAKLTSLTSLQIGDGNQIGEKGCEHLGKLTSLTSLEIGEGNHIGEKGCEHLAKLTSLTSLHIGDGNQLDEKGCEHLGKLTSLTSLKIGLNNEIGEKGCKHLAKLTSLTSLGIGEGNHIGEKGCEHLAKLTSLTSLHIGDGNHIDEKGCEHLRKLTSLTSLKIGDQSYIGEKGCEHLAKLTSLTSLQIGQLNYIDEKGCEHLAKLTSLTCLEIGQYSSIGEFEVGEKGCEHLARLASLTSLKIGDYSDIGEKGCEHLAKLTSLTSLEIGAYSEIGEKGCKHLAKLTGLTSLQIGQIGPFSEIGEKGCEHLAKLTNLTSLEIGDHNDIGEKGCKHLAKLPSLTSLKIGPFNEIGEKGCEHLAKLTSLTSLEIGDHNHIGEIGCEHLAKLTSLTSLQIGEEQL